MKRILLIGMLGVVSVLTASASQDDPLADEAAFDVFDTGHGSPRPCDRVREHGKFVVGGCRASGYAFQSRLAIRTAFGTMPFGECVMSFDFVLSREGRIWLDRLRIGGGSPCNDAVPCAPASVLRTLEPGDRLPPAAGTPWRGRIEAAAGGARHSGYVDVCIDTCAGRFQGRTRIALVRGDAGWELRASRSGVGAGGLEIDSGWPLRDAAFNIGGFRR